MSGSCKKSCRRGERHSKKPKLASSKTLWSLWTTGWGQRRRRCVAQRLVAAAAAVATLLVTTLGAVASATVATLLEALLATVAT